MKYEISQEQYVSYLNTLTWTQQASRTVVNPSSPVGTLAVAGNSQFPQRNRIEIKTSGVTNTTPAVYGCDLNNNGVFDETDDGQNIACNWLAWSDLMAYLDWAALRPMTEFEYEKICRGASPASLGGEYVWSTTAITQAVSSSLNNAGLVNETSTAALDPGSGIAEGTVTCADALAPNDILALLRLVDDCRCPMTVNEDVANTALGKRGGRRSRARVEDWHILEQLREECFGRGVIATGLTESPGPCSASSQHAITTHQYSCTQSPSPCATPQATKVQPAPCQRPQTSMVMIRF
jgi:hypothetical protein